MYRRKIASYLTPRQQFLGSARQDDPVSVGQCSEKVLSKQSRYCRLEKF